LYKKGLKYGTTASVNRYGGIVAQPSAWPSRAAALQFPH